MFDPTRDVDVHMASDGANMQCVDCHRAENHQMLGKVYSVSSMNRNRVDLRAVPPEPAARGRPPQRAHG